MQVARYLIVGFLSLALFVGLSSALSTIGIPNALCAGTSFLVVGAVNYLLHRLYTFQSTKLVSSSLPRYAILLTINALMGAAFVYLAADYFGLPLVPVNLACAMALTAITYIAMKSAVM